MAPSNLPLLKEGDSITIYPGMSVSVEIPEMFVYSNKRDSKKLVKTTVKLGSVLDNEHGETFDTKKFLGQYIVNKTILDGGGVGHGAGDVYPDGHHVYAVKVNKDGESNENVPKIDFYQTGAFNCMIKPEDIQADNLPYSYSYILNKKEGKLLQEDDIITIYPGMDLSVQIPEKFVYSNRRDSDTLIKSTIKVGGVLSNGKGETFDTKQFLGTYIVNKTTLDGGGAGHGAGDVYPDGHHVFAIKCDPNNEYKPLDTKVEFYQTGAFNCMITPEDIQAEGKMQKTWVVTPTKDLKSKIGTIREDSETPSVGKKMTKK